MFVEQVLTERIGDVGKKLHTARSRNDQVALDLRMYLRTQIDEITVLVKDVIEAILLQAEANKESKILEAEAKREAAIREAEGEAEAIRMVQQATADGIKMLVESQPNKEVIALQSLEAFEKAADGQATKIIIPSDIASLAGLATSVGELMKSE
jgi:hypothetical protein